MLGASADAVITLLLYLIGAPALLLQSTESEVRSVLLKQLRPLLIQRMVAPAVIGLGAVIVLNFFADLLNGIWPALHSSDALFDLSLLVLLGLVIYVSLVTLPFSRKQNVIALLEKNAQTDLQRVGHPSDDNLDAITLIGTESAPGDEKGWSIAALTSITNAMTRLEGYHGYQVEGLIISLRSVLLEGEKIGSLENFKGAIKMLRGVIQTYYKRSKLQPSFSNADMGHAYDLLGEMGKTALDFPVKGISLTCVGAIASNQAINSAASQKLAEIGMAAVEHDCMVVAMDVHNRFKFAIGNTQGPVEDEVLYDYLGLLSSFWQHGETARRMVKQNLDDLKRGIELRVLTGKAIKHCADVNQYSTADHIREMWEGYLRLS